MTINLFVNVSDAKAFTNRRKALSVYSQRRLEEYMITADSLDDLKQGQMLYCVASANIAYTTEAAAQKVAKHNGSWVFTAELDTSVLKSLEGKTMQVYINQHDDGRFSAGVRMNPDDPFSNRMKNFFPDQNWTGPIFEGVAEITITKDLPSYGFFTGKMILMQKQDEEKLANKFADLLLAKNPAIHPCNKVFLYNGVRGTGYLVQLNRRIGGNGVSYQNYADFDEDSGTYKLLLQKDVDPKDLSDDSMSVIDFVAKYCYGRKDMRIVELMTPAKTEKFGIPAPFDTAMNRLDSMMASAEEQNDFDTEALLKILFDAGFVRMAMFADLPIIKPIPLYLPENIVKLFDMSKAELEYVIQFVSDCNQATDKKIASLSRSGKIRLAV